MEIGSNLHIPKFSLFLIGKGVNFRKSVTNVVVTEAPTLQKRAQTASAHVRRELGQPTKTALRGLQTKLPLRFGRQPFVQRCFDDVIRDTFLPQFLHEAPATAR